MIRLLFLCTESDEEPIIAGVCGLQSCNVLIISGLSWPSPQAGLTILRMAPADGPVRAVGGADLVRQLCARRTSLVCEGKLQRNGDSMYKSRGINRYQPDIWRLVREIATRRACRCTSETCTSRTSPFCRKCCQAALTAARMGTADGHLVRHILPGGDSLDWPMD